MLPSARLGDQHTCPLPGHGTTPINSASSDILINFMGAARVGDTCGCGAVITTGFPSIIVNGRPMAHLDSPTSHGGKIITGSADVVGGFISMATPTSAVVNFAAMGAISADGVVDDNKLANLLADPQLEAKAEALGALLKPLLQSDTASNAAQPSQQPATAEPGFYVVQQPMPRAELEAQLFTRPDAAVLAKFRALNPSLSAYAKPGQMIVLSDPNNSQCTREEALLMEAAASVNAALAPMSDEEASFMLRHRDEIESMLAQGATSIGVGEAIFAKNLDAVKRSLSDIEALHQRSFQRDGHLRSEQFFNERKRLFNQLDNSLTFLTKKSTGFPDHPKLKTALGISSRNLVHDWSKAGAPGQIPGYATHYAGVAKAATYVKYGGWIGTAVGGGASYMKVQDVCMAGSSEACERVKYVEGGSFAGGIIGGVISGAVLSGSASGAVCIALGIATGGVGSLACGVIVVGAGSFVAGAISGAGGEVIGEVVFEASK